MCEKFIRSILLTSLLVLILASGARAADPSLLGWWKLDEGSGDIVHDSSGSSNHGTINNLNGGLGPGGSAWDVDPERGTVLSFNGNDSSGTYVSAGTIPAMSLTNGFTWAFWAKQQGDGTGVNQVVLGNRYGGAPAPGSGQFIKFTPTRFEYYYGGHNGTIDYEDLPPGEWLHHAVVKDGATLTYYRNGVVANTSTTTATIDANPFFIGGDVNSEDWSGWISDVRIYARALTETEVQWAMRGIPPGVASGPSPDDQATDVSRDVVLSWTPGEFAPAANGHIVYLSETFSDVNDGISGTTVSAASYDPGRLDLGATYYWRVDEVNAPPDSTVYPGEVWSFTIEPVGYPIDGSKITATASSSGQANLGPENTINGSGLNADGQHSTEATHMWLSGNEPSGAWIQYEFDKPYKLHEMWVWNSNQVFEGLFGFGMKTVTVEYSTDGAAWTVLAGVPEFTKAPGKAGYAHDTTVDFGGAAAKFIKLTATSNWGGVLPQYGLSEVRFFAIPVSAREPSPASGAAGAIVDGFLGWRAGRDAGIHNVYLSTDRQAVIDGTTQAVSVAEASYSSDLDLDQTYYWRVDEVNDVETPAVWQGDLWDFTTQQFIVVDGFEDYNDYPPYEIYSTWLDGYENPTNGSQVGNLTPPLAETTIVHGGVQSMPLFYSNTGGAAFSEAERTFVSPQNWTKHGITTLAIWFRGMAGNTGQMYVKINTSKVLYDGQAGNIALPGWQVWNIDLPSSGLNLQSVNNLAIGIDGNGATGTLYVDDIGLYAAAPAPPNEWRITNDDDDVEERIGPNNGAIDMGSSDLEMPYEDAGQVDPQIVGLRFTGIPIPQGATITDAWVQFQVDENKGGTDPVNLIIEGELSVNPAVFTSTAGSVSSRPKTAAKVQWSVSNWTIVGDNGPDQRTPSLASIIQEIVNQPGWAGEAIVLIIRDNPANPSVGIRCAVAGPGDDAVLLHIDYQ